MKSQLLISSMLLGTPVFAMPAMSLNDINTTVINQQRAALEMQFLSKQLQKDEMWVNIDDEWKKVAVEFRVQVSFYSADKSNYSYEGSGSMRYEVRFEFIDVSGKKIFLGHADSTFYAKRIGRHTFKIFNCDSTSSCYDAPSNRTFKVYNSAKGRVLRVRRQKPSDTPHVVPFYDRSFIEVDA